MISVVFAHLNQLNNLMYSVLSQLDALEYAKQDYEIIIVDNGSQEYEILENWVERIQGDHNIKLLREEVKGPPIVFQKGAEAASGDFVAFSDCHVYVKHDFYTLIMPHFKNPKIGTVYPATDIDPGLFGDKALHYGFNRDSYYAKAGAHRGVTKPYKIKVAQQESNPIRMELYKAFGMFNKNAFLDNGGYTADEMMAGIKTWMWDYEVLMEPRAVAVHGYIAPNPLGDYEKREKLDSMTTLCWLLQGKEKAQSVFEEMKHNSSYKSWEEFCEKNEANIIPERQFILDNQKYSYDEIWEMWNRKKIA